MSSYIKRQDLDKIESSFWNVIDALEDLEYSLEDSVLKEQVFCLNSKLEDLVESFQDIILLNAKRRV